MGWQQQVFIGSLVLVFGTGANTGLFVYNGTPSATNPPIFWVTTATKDPFGNSIPSTAGMDTNFLVYSGAPILGNLIASISNAGGTDTLGNVFNTGINAYVAVGGVTYAVGLSLPGISAFPGFSVQDVTNPPFLPAGVFGRSSNGATKRARMQLYSGVVDSVVDVGSQIFVESQTDSGVSSGYIQVACLGTTDIGSPAVLRVTALNGGVQFIAPVAAPPAPATGTILYTPNVGGFNQVSSLDNQNYNIGHHETSAAGNQLINSITATAVTGSTLTVGISTYHLKYVVFYKGSQAAGNPVFSIGGTSVTSFARWRNLFTTGGGVAAFSAAISNGVFGNMSGPTLLNGTLQLFEFEAWITFSSGGTFLLQAFEGVNGDPFTIDSVFVRLEPRQVS